MKVGSKHDKQHFVDHFCNINQQKSKCKQFKVIED